VSVFYFSTLLMSFHVLMCRGETAHSLWVCVMECRSKVARWLIICNILSLLWMVC